MGRNPHPTRLSLTLHHLTLNQPLKLTNLGLWSGFPTTTGSVVVIPLFHSRRLTPPVRCSQGTSSPYTSRTETLPYLARPEQGYVVKERRFGRFVRTIRLSEGTKVSNEFPSAPDPFGRQLVLTDIKVSMENGILTVCCPKSSPNHGSRRITIN